MTTKQFRLACDSAAFDIDISSATDIDALRRLLGHQFGVVKPDGIGLESEKGALDDISEVHNADSAISITVDGQTVRETPGPTGLPFIGSYFEGDDTA
jgi:hypothetical protein